MDCEGKKSLEAERIERPGGKSSGRKENGRESKEERKKEKSTEKEKCRELKTELLETAGKTERTHSYQVAKSYKVRYKH